VLRREPWGHRHERPGEEFGPTRCARPPNAPTCWLNYKAPRCLEKAWGKPVCRAAKSFSDLCWAATRRVALRCSGPGADLQGLHGDPMTPPINGVGSTHWSHYPGCRASGLQMALPI